MATTPVIALQKLKNLLARPTAGPGNGIEDGSNRHLDGSQMYGNHRGNQSPTLPSSSGGSMLVVPQPITAIKGNGSANGRKYQCKMCPQIFGSKADLQLHTQVHMREAKPYKCSQCSKAFANSSYLSQHNRIHLGIKPYRCEMCQRKFTQLSHLQQHIRTHTGDKPYKCRHPGCNKAFSQLSNLQSHSRCHQTDKPFKCNSCYKCFHDEVSLLEHIPKHKESKHLKTHICQFCGKSYTQDTYLAKHMQKHTDKRNNAAANNHHHHQQQQILANSRTDFWTKTNSSNPGEGLHITDTSCLQSPLVDRLHLQEHRQTNGRADMSPHLGQGQLSYEAAVKTSTTSTSSAFTPIQANMLPAISVAGNPGASRSYFPYEPINFPKHNQHQNEAKTFPNQLISLHQIRNYASMPSLTGGGEHPITMKDKHNPS